VEISSGMVGRTHCKSVIHGKPIGFSKPKGWPSA
jgi:hypothetical protein